MHPCVSVCCRCEVCLLGDSSDSTAHVAAKDPLRPSPEGVVCICQGNKTRKNSNIFVMDTALEVVMAQVNGGIHGHGRTALQAASAGLWHSAAARPWIEHLETMPGPRCSEKSNLLVSEPEDFAVAGKQCPPDTKNHSASYCVQPSQSCGCYPERCACSGYTTRLLAASSVITTFTPSQINSRMQVKYF